MSDVGFVGFVKGTYSVGTSAVERGENGCDLDVLMSVECWDVSCYVVFWDGP